MGLKVRAGDARVLLIVGVLAAGLSTTAAHALEVTLDFDDLTVPTLITSQYQDTHGIVFPTGITVAPCEPDHCGAARSAPNVAHAGHDNEQQGHPLVFEIPNGAASNTDFYVRSDLNAFGAAAREILIGAQAFDAGGLEVSRDYAFTTTHSPWQSIQLGSPTGPSTIKRVEVRIFGVRPDVNRNIEENFVAVDDLRVQGDIVLPERDRISPTTAVRDPSAGTFITGSVLEARLTAEDDRDLATVTAIVSNPATGQRSDAPLCGSPSTQPCGTSFDQSVTLSLAGIDHGLIQLLVDARDAAGNRGISGISLHYVDVYTGFLEVNQGVQNGPSFLSDPEGRSTYFHGAYLIRGRDTLVRYYPFAHGYTAGGFAPSLIVDIIDVAGQTKRIEVPLNAGTSSVRPASSSEDFFPDLDEAMKMRTDLARTLNYVIPGAELARARDLDLQLRYHGRELPGVAEVAIREGAAVGINLVSFDLPGQPIVDRDPAINGIVPYLRAAYPVNDVRVLSWRSFRPSPSIFEGALDDGSDLLYELWWEYGGDDTPFTFDPGEDYVVATTGVAPGPQFGSEQGRGYVGGSYWGGTERIGATNWTIATGDVAAQELGHNLGLGHVSGSHSENPSGFSTYPHGAIGAQNFGIVATATTPPGPGAFGTWIVTLVNPCGTGAAVRVSAAYACNDHSLDEVHDFMSYGGNASQTPQFTTSAGMWVSVPTWRALWESLTLSAPIGSDVRAGGGPPSAPSASGGERVEAFLIGADITADGVVHPKPVGRKPVPSAMLTADAPEGNVLVELLDREGSVLANVRVDPSQMHQEVDDGRRFLRAVVPYVPGVSHLRISGSGVETLTLTATEHAPFVRITAPAAGSDIPDGRIRVAFEGSDADGNPLKYMVQYSPDGRRWQGIEDIGPGETPEVFIDSSQLIPGDHALFRVMATDGLNTTVAVVDCISVGAGAPTCDRGLDIKPASCPNVVNPNAAGVLPAAITGAGEGDIALIDPSSVRLEGVPAVRSTVDDVASGFTPYSGKELPTDCSVAGPDGLDDLALKFDMDALRSALGPVQDGESRVLHLTGSLIGGGSFTAEDVVVFARGLR